MLRDLLAQQFQEFLIELEVILLEVLVKIVSAEHLRDLDELVAVAVAHEEGLLLENLR